MSALLALPAGAAAPRNLAADALSRQGGMEMRAGRAKEAAEFYRGAAALRHDEREAVKDLMWALWRAGDKEATIDAASRVLKGHAQDLEALNLLAVAQFSAGHTRQALKSYLSSDALAPGQEHVSRALAALFEKFKDYPRALERCEILLQARPRDAGLLAQRGRLLFLQGRWGESASSLRDALSRSPAAPGLRLQLARSLDASGSRLEAVAELQGLLKSDPRDSLALELLTQISIVNKRLDWALPALKRAQEAGWPSDEAHLLALANLYEGAGNLKQGLKVIDDLLARHPDGGAILRDKGEMLDGHGRHAEAAAIFARLTRLNPTSSLAWRRWAEALDAQGRGREALAAMEKARALDPTDPYLLIAYSRLLYEDGRENAGRAVLEGWLNARREETLPVLLYHGLALRAKDPMLAAPVHIPATVFREHMKALKNAGFVPITADQAAAWLHNRGKLPPRPVLITFDDARLDAFRSADPILREFGLKAAMFAPLSNVEGDLPGFSSWEELKAYRDTGRWDIQAHGDQGHTFIRRDAQGRQGRFLTNRRWLPEEARLETVEEWERRASGDHESSKAKLLARLGSAPSSFAYPEGEYGQQEAPNLPDSAPRNLVLCAKSYAVCYQQDGKGLNAPGRDPARAVRVEPRADWSGERLVRHIRDQSPFVQVRRALLHHYAWSGRTHAADLLLEKNRAAGISQPVLLADEARILWGAGDRPGGLELARRALELDPGPEYRALFNDYSRPRRRGWTPELSYFDDDKDRRSLRFRQTLGAWDSRLGDISVSHHSASFREPGAPTVLDNGVGLELRRVFKKNHEAAASVEGRFLGAGARDTYGLVGVERSRWSDSLATSVQIARLPYENARSLLAGIDETMLSLSATQGQDSGLQAGGRFKAASLSDGNSRFSGAANLSAPLAPWPEVRFILQISGDNARRVSPAYYSPQSLRLFQAGLSWSGQPRPWLKASAGYLPGYAEERGIAGNLSHQLDAAASVRTGRLILRPTVSWTRTPNYKSKSFALALDFAF